MLCSSLKLYLCVLSVYASGVDDDEAAQITIEYTTDMQACFESWLQNPDIGFGDYFGRKNDNKIKDEIKVCKYAI